MTPLETVKLKIIVLSQMRDAIKEVSPAYVFRSMQHRDELYNAIIQALEELEDELEELEEKEEIESEDEEAEKLAAAKRSRERWGD